MRRHAAVLSDKYIKAKISELKKLSARNIDPSWGDDTKLPKFFKDLIGEIEEQGVSPFFSNWLTGWLQHITEQIEGRRNALASSLNKLSLYWEENMDFRQQLEWEVASSLKDYLQGQIKTEADAVASEWGFDPKALSSLAAKLGKSPDLQAAWARDMDSSGRVGERFYRALGDLLPQVKKLVRKKKGWKPSDWLNHLWSVLEHESKQEAAREIDLYGIKVVLDPFMPSTWVKRYLRELDITHQLLARKGLAQKTWYGTIFLSEGGGEVNFLTGGGVGGSFRIAPDEVTLSTRDFQNIPYMVAHELGHRYWFKGMSESQRARFEQWIRVHETRRPSLTVGDTDPEAYVGPTQKETTKMLQELRADSENVSARSLSRVWMNRWYRILDVLRTNWPKNVPQGGTLEHLLQSYVTLVPEDADALVGREEDLYLLLKGKLSEFFREAQEYLAALHTESISPQQADVEWMREYEKDPRPVAPVSTYGSMSIHEAFAEVFAHYVLGEDLTRDQLESFKAVLSKTASRVANVAWRWISRAKSSTWLGTP